MRHPPYQLKPNKAVDRFLLIDLLQQMRVTDWFDMSTYTYYGFGGPFLEDCRLLRRYCPEVKIASIEANKHTYLRQLFHQFGRDITLIDKNFGDFLTSFASNGTEIFWLDYTNLEASRLEDFRRLINLADDGSIIKITLRAELPYNPLLRDLRTWETEEDRDKDFKLFLQEFNDEFKGYTPPGIGRDEFDQPMHFVTLILKMIQLTAQNALPVRAHGSIFHILNAATYSDGTQMLSVTGIVYPYEQRNKIEDCFRSWHFFSQTWDTMHKIDVPVLSMKERLKLEKLLPVKNNTGKALLRTLGYNIDKTENSSLERLKQYAAFYKYYPYFVKIDL